MNALTTQDEEAIDKIVSDIETAWNAADASAFSAHFAGDATQVNIYGTELIGAEQIRERHEHIFKTLFRGSTNTLRVLSAGYVSPGVILSRVSSTVEVPHGPLRGTLRTRGSLVLRKSGSNWEIVLFHNTRVEPAP